jgi:formyltetrahydrofolate deformylase
VAVSKQRHCLNSLLHRWSINSEWYGVPFHHFPIEPGKKAEQEARILELFVSTDSELLVLARYMQILSDETCRKLAGRCINIHHSFLPGFKGARPYHQAYERGVKIIGATAHYSTADLVEIGHDIEAIVLNNAVRWHAEHRIFITGNRTVVLHS